jgi:hypothetical protein
MDPSVRADARIGDVPDVSSHALMERDTPVNLYIAITIGIGVICVILLLLWAFV